MDKNEAIKALVQRAYAFAEENQIPVLYIAAAGLALTDVAIGQYEENEEAKQAELPSLLEAVAELAVEWNDLLSSGDKSRVLN